MTEVVAGVSAAVVAAGSAAIVWWRVRSRISPAEAERRRRSALAATGKLGDATLHETQDSFLIYAYDVGGVTYGAAQDISALRGRVPLDEESIFGAVLVKYDPKNPANSIVVSEEWSGFRTTLSRK